ncbi:MAG: hypothetical protein AAF206_17405, partial [Bacteroidota bacterium]
ECCQGLGSVHKEVKINTFMKNPDIQASGMLLEPIFVHISAALNCFSPAFSIFQSETVYFDKLLTSRKF